MQFYKRAFGNTKIPNWEEFKTSLQQGEAAAFAEGYFVRKAEDLRNMLECRNIGQYIFSLPPVINNIYGLCALHVLGLERQITKSSSTEFREMVNITNRKLDPEITITGLKVDAAELSRDVTRHFGFDFRKRVIDLNNFAWALNVKTTHENKQQVLGFMANGPETLRNINLIYNAAEQYLTENSIEFPVSTLMKLQKPLEDIARALEEKLEHPRAHR